MQNFEIFSMCGSDLSQRFNIHDSKGCEVVGMGRDRTNRSAAMFVASFGI